VSNKELKNILVAIAIKELIANRWNNLDMKKLSKLSKCPLEDILLLCSSKNKLLDYWSDKINFEMVNNLSIEELQKVSKKERVLELMLCRFDVIKSKKKEVDALIKLSKKSLIESTYSFNRALKGMKLILNYSDIPTKGPLGLIKIKALTIIWLLSLRDWNKGDISNEEAFMAILDKRLSFAEKVNQIIS
tara:strand:+ start:444 stop:1013 length:570 start_codon:yes stop_codon:yes gene_type:complete